MPDYYNRSRTPVAIGLRNGQSVVIGPKHWSYVDPEDEGTESLLSAVGRGDLVRARVDKTLKKVEPTPVVESLPVMEPAPVTAAIPLTEVVPVETSKILVEKKKKPER